MKNSPVSLTPKKDHLRGSRSPVGSSPKRSPYPTRRKGFDSSPLSNEPRSQREQSQQPSSSEEDDNYSRKSPRPLRMNVTREEMSEPETPSRGKKERKKDDKSSNYSLMCVFLVGIFAFCIYKNPLNSKMPDKICKFQDLKQKYTGQDDFLWKSLEIGIENTINKKSESPAIYLFIYQRNPSKVMDLINKIINRASECFDPSLEPAQMNPKDFTSQAALDDYGIAIEKYKKLVDQGNVLLIAGLNDFPAKAARALHAICDSQNPIKNRVVIFLTLEVPTLEGKSIEIAENTLRSLWENQIKDSELEPIITRVTDQVVAVRM
ncbi:hypothetical protein ACFFRR_010855 [Megaselia abdita]